jgi:hypothetical protein
LGTGYSPKLPLLKGSFCFHTFFPFFKIILLVYSTSADSESILLQVLTRYAFKIPSFSCRTIMATGLSDPDTLLPGKE